MHRFSATTITKMLLLGLA